MYKCCPVAKKCSGCQLQNMSYEEQLVFKQNVAEKYLSKFGTVNKIIGMYYPYHYRNKVQAYFIQARGGKIVSGVYQSKTKGIAAVDSCMIEDKKADEIVVTIRNLMKSLKLTAYDRTNDAGFLRHVLIRRAFKTGQIMVVLAASTPLFPNKNVFIKELLKAHPEITTIIHNIADDKTETMVLGEREIVLHGNGYIEDTLCGCKFRISSKSFYQINPQQTEVLYKKAMEYAGLKGNETVVDAYCGIGTIGLIASKNAKNVISVESNKQAVRDAVQNAKLNNAKNIRFYNDDATEFMVKMADEKMKADVLIMDPPRAGSTKEFLEAAIKLSPSKIVYISCNPETQEKDLMRLTRNGYTVEKIQPVDMFPHTKHVETCVLLCHQKATKYATFDYTPDGSYMDELNKHASYREINEYIEAKYGYKVHSAYIAQVKRECGIEMGENYNLSQCEDYEPKLVTEEKRKAIKEALKHFNMID